MYNSRRLEGGALPIKDIPFLMDFIHSTRSLFLLPPPCNPSSRVKCRTCGAFVHKSRSFCPVSTFPFNASLHRQSVFQVVANFKRLIYLFLLTECVLTSCLFRNFLSFLAVVNDLRLRDRKTLDASLALFRFTDRSAI